MRWVKQADDVRVISHCLNIVAVAVPRDKTVAQAQILQFRMAY